MRRTGPVVVTALAFACGFARAQEQERTDEPASRPAYPALEQLNRECLALYERLQGSVVRVQVPQPANRFADSATDAPWKRYKVNPDMRLELQKRSADQQQFRGNVSPNPVPPAHSDGGGQADAPPPQPGQQSVQPRPQTAPQPVQVAVATNNLAAGTGNLESNSAKQQQQSLPPPHNGVTIVIPPQQAYANSPGEAQQPAQQQLVLDNAYFGNRGGGGSATGNNRQGPLQQAAVGFAPNAIGLLLSDRGHVLVPTFVDREVVGDQPIRFAWGAGGDVAEARLVGADHQTQLSVLQLSPPAVAGLRREANFKPAGNAAPAGEAGAKAKVDAKADAAANRPAAGRPVALSDRKLTDGTLVLVVSPVDGVGRLTVWNGGGAREAGVVVTIDGEVAGIARTGQFLPGGACRLIADQIVRHGAVRRATLGVIITQVDPSDPARQQLAELGDKPAVRVDQVVKGSVAERGGLRQGDLILTLGGEPVHDIPSLAAAIAARSGRTDLTVLRDGRVTPVTVDLVQR